MDWLHAMLFTAHSELRKVLFLALSVTFLFVYEISREPLNGFAPNSHTGKTCLVPRSDEFECQDRTNKKRHFLALSAVCVRFMFGKTSLASSFFFLFVFFFLRNCAAHVLRARCIQKKSVFDFAKAFRLKMVYNILVDLTSF